MTFKTCTHKWEVSHIEKWTKYCNGENCDHATGDHGCGIFQEYHYTCVFCGAEASETELELEEAKS